MKPIEVYKEACKENKITDKLNVPPIQRASWLQEQIGQQKMVLNRLLLDLTASKWHMNLAKDEISKSAHRKKCEQYADDIYQIREALKMNLALLDEFRAEYPELKAE